MATVEIPDPVIPMFTFIIANEEGAPRSEQFHEYVDLPYRLMKGDIIYLPAKGKEYLITSGARINMTGKRERRGLEWVTVGNEFDETGTAYYARMREVETYE